VSIVAACPHCESRFHLQPDLIGKAMRCPNPDCREPFVVEEAKGKKKPAGPKVVDAKVVKPKPASGPTVAPDLPPIFAEADDSEVVEALVVPPPPPPKATPKPANRPAPPKVVEAQVVAPPAPAREVVWSPDADVPIPGAPIPPKKPEPQFEVVREEPKPKPEPARVDDDDDDLLLARRRKKKKSNRGPLILIGMLVAIVLAGGGALWYVLKTNTANEENEAQQADDQYAKGDFGPASKAYEELHAKNPAGPNADRFRFMSDLAATRLAVSSVSSFENPSLALEKIKTFIQVHKDSPLAKPDKNGLEVFDSGRKLLEDFHKHVMERLAAYKADRKTKLAELKKAEDALAQGLEFVPLLKDFRDRDAKSLDQLKLDLNAGAADTIAYERKRLAVLEQIRTLVSDPTDEAIQNGKTYAATNALQDDAEVVEVIQTAEANFLKAIRFEREPADARAPSASGSSLIFATPIGDTKPSQRGPDDPSSVFLAVARGILYALDEETGNVLWAVRVGPDTYDPPTVAQVPLPEGPTELALVTSNVAGRPMLTAYTLRTGQPRWSQPLDPKVPPGGDVVKMPPSPAAGAAVVVGNRAYLPIRDASGSVLVFDIATGLKIGRIVVGQAIGPGAFLRPGTSHLYIAADSRRLFVFDVEAIAAGGDATCLRVIPTDHPTGALRALPSILGQPGDDPSPRFLILSQAGGASEMRLRAIPLPPTPSVPPGGPPVLEPLLGGGVDLPLTGWVWFPPVSDSERLTVVTDRNQFRIFGVNQPGNKDAALFPLPFPPIPEPPGDRPIRGLVVPAEEGSYWVLVGGSLLKYRLTLVPSQGLTLVPAGAGLPIGEPSQPAQLNAKRDTACFVVQSANSTGCRAVAVKLRDGAPRWQRQLGLILSTPPLRTAAGTLVVDGDGAAVTVPEAAAAKTEPTWIAASPLDGLSRPTVTAASPDGKLAFTLSPTGDGAVAKWIIRRATNGKFDHAGSVNAPGELAGQPVVFNGTLLIPASDGFIHRLVIGDGRGVPDKLAGGPKWLLKSAGEKPECFLLPLANDLFIASDGGKTLKRWAWPAGGGVADDNASWTLREAVAVAPVLLPGVAGKPARLIAADITGGVTLFGLDRTDNLIRRWVPGVTAALPQGRIASDIGVHTDAAGRSLVAYAVNRKQIVCVDVDADAPKWITPAVDDAGAAIVGSPVPLADGRWLVTDLGGRVMTLAADTGAVLLKVDAGLPGAVPQTAAVPLGAARALVPLSDGSAALVELSEKK